MKKSQRDQSPNTTEGRKDHRVTKPLLETTSNLIQSIYASHQRWGQCIEHYEKVSNKALMFQCFYVQCFISCGEASF